VLQLASYLQARLRWLLAHPGFRSNPAAVSSRLAVWLAYCAVGYSPRFRLMNGVWCQVDPVLRRSGSSSAFVLRRWAEPELRYLDQLLGPRATFIDCGANIGAYSMCAASIVGPHGKVVAVEPSEVSFRRLRANVDLNGFTQVVTVKKAISDAEGIARLYHADGGPVSFSLVRDADEESEEVETTTIDDLVDELRLERVDAIKLDIEGAEILALRGGGETITKFKPTIIFELSSPGARRLASAQSVPSLLAGHGYGLYRFRSDPILRRQDFKSPNLVAIHAGPAHTAPPFLEACGLDKSCVPCVEFLDRHAGLVGWE
jgi:FkbM family methyltransferase